MRKALTIILIGLLLSSCSNEDDDGIDCSLFDPAFPSLYLRIVDDTGANLIENGTIDPNNIGIEGDFENAGFQFIPANEFALSMLRLKTVTFWYSYFFKNLDTNKLVCPAPINNNFPVLEKSDSTNF